MNIWDNQKLQLKAVIPKKFLKIVVDIRQTYVRDVVVIVEILKVRDCYILT